MREIGAGEVKRLARDRRALFTAVILPALIYPLIFHGRAWLESLSSQTLAERTVRIALDVAQAPAEIALGLERDLGARAGVELMAFDDPELLDELHALSEGLHEGRPEALERQRELAARALEHEIDALVSVERHAVLAGRQVLRVYHDGSDELSGEAARRIGLSLAVLEDEVRTLRLEELLGARDPARGLDPVAVDLASEEQSGGATLGQLLPLLAVLVLISAGSFAALSVFAGEREAGTLETLLVQPVPTSAVAWGKFYAVLAVALAGLAVNVGSLFVSLALGLGALPGLAPGSAGGVVLAAGGGRLALAALLFLPAGVLLAALLALISSRASTFRAGQQLLMPFFLAAAVPGAIAGWTDVPCDLLTALAPLLGGCLAVREALRGSLDAGPAAVTWIAGCLWAGLALRALAHSFSAERVLAHGVADGLAPSDHAGREGRAARTALAFGGTAVLVLYLVGGWLQARLGIPGLLLTLWGLLPLLAWLCARAVAARTGESLAQALGLAWPSAQQVAGVLCCAPGLAWLVRTLAELQSRVAPLPASVLESAGNALWFADAGPLALFFVLALSPGVCEELFFRGALLSGLRRGLPPGRVVFWQALLFGAAHASVYRFLPSAAVGALLAAIALRTRSVVPAILLHVAYDGFQVLAFQATWAADPALALFAIPGLYILWREPRRASAGRLSAAPVTGP